MIFANETVLTEEEKKFFESYVNDEINGCKWEPINCNHCIYRKDVSRHLDMEDYCVLNKKKICRIDMDKDCLLEGLEGNNK